MGSMKSGNVCLGLLAHVDAGKTTLSESLLYLSGAIRKKGRVDHGDTFLDTDSLERERGITIFSKQAELQAGSLTFTLMDTPGHRDFSPEMERTLQILDEAVLVISAADGVTGQVRNLWKLLKHYDIPTFIFVNKMDQPGTDRKEIFRELQSALGPVLADVTDGLETESVQEDVAVCDDALMERFLDGVPVTDAGADGTEKAGSGLVWLCPENGRRGSSVVGSGEVYPEKGISRRIRGKGIQN